MPLKGRKNVQTVTVRNVDGGASYEEINMNNTLICCGFFTADFPAACVYGGVLLKSPGYARLFCANLDHFISLRLFKHAEPD